MNISLGDLDRLGDVLRDYRRVRDDYATMVEATSGRGQECTGCHRLIPGAFLSAGKCAECWMVEYNQMRDIVVDLHWHAALYLDLDCRDEAKRSWDTEPEAMETEPIVSD